MTKKTKKDQPHNNKNQLTLEKFIQKANSKNITIVLSDDEQQNKIQKMDIQQDHQVKIHKTEKKQILKKQSIKKQINQLLDQSIQIQIQKPKKQKISRKDIVESDLSASQSIPNQKLESMPNVQFYLNKRPSYPNGDLIDVIHTKWRKNYELLQRHHGFIQWLFPNPFKSRFNSNSHPLSNQEQKLFRSNPIIYERYLKSYNMMLQFYGMKLKSKITGQIIKTRIPDYKQRFKNTLQTNFHNHMRITRILCSLTMVGFGRYAKQLCLFLKKQIQAGDLRSLDKYGVYKDWKDYQKYQQTEDDLSDFFKNGKVLKLEKQYQKNQEIFNHNNNNNDQNKKSKL